MSNKRFHIGRNNTPRECKAKGVCPLGGKHFNNKRDAYKYIQEKSKAENKILPTYSARVSDTRGNKREVIKRITDPNVIARYEGFENPTLHSQEGSIFNRMKCVDLDAKRLAYYEVDKGHRNGPEVHCVKEDASILIYNKNTARFITVLLARPGQLDTYISEELRVDDHKAIDNLYENARVNVFTQANRINDEWSFNEDEIRVYKNLKEDVFKR